MKLIGDLKEHINKSLKHRRTQLKRIKPLKSKDIYLLKKYRKAQLNRRRN